MRKHSHNFQDLTDKRFVNWLVISISHTNKLGRVYWLCVCDCGTKRAVAGLSLKNGDSTGCGCTRRENLVGQLFGYLLVVRLFSVNNYIARWLCLCECGKETIVSHDTLKCGTTISCGCYKRKSTSKRMSGKNNPNYRHDLTKEEREENKNRGLCPKNRKWRNKVFKRDNYTCQCCGDNKGGNLEAHHIFSYHSHKHLRHITSNGITLCESCHKKFHKEYGRKSNTRKQFNKFKNDYKKISN